MTSGVWPSGSQPISSARPDACDSAPLREVWSKLGEAEHFLARMTDKGLDPVTYEYELNAFASAARSVTFAMQAAMASHPGVR